MARLDTGWHANPKILQLSLAGMALHAWSISYCDATRSDGLIPSGAWPAKMQPGVKALRDAGLWTACDGGYQLHDYLQYNRSRRQIEALQAADRERKRPADSGRNHGGNGADSGGIPRAPGPGPGDGPFKAVSPGTGSYFGGAVSPTPTPPPNPDGGDPFEAAPRGPASPQTVAAAMERLYGPPTKPERLPNGAQQCPLCPDIFTCSYAEHLESPRHKIHDQPADLSGFHP